MVTGLLSCGFSLGAMAGPVISGAITDGLDFAWSQTIVASMCLFLVSFSFTYFCKAFLYLIKSLQFCSFSAISYYK